MRIAVDGRELGGRATGVGRYLAHLLQAWETLDEASGHEFVLYVPTDTADEHRGALPGMPALVARDDRGPSRPAFTVRQLGGRAGTWWEQTRLAAAVRRDRPDVLFAPAYTAPLATRVPTVLTVHDVSFVAHPEWFPPRARLRRGLATRVSARRARRILTVSEFSRREIVRLLGVEREKVAVIPLGFSPVGGTPAGPARMSGELGARTILYVGSVFNRRHVPELIRAFAVVAPAHPGLRLEIVGDNRTYPWQDLQAVAAEAGVSEATTIRSYVGEEALAALYSRAAVFAFLSDYEGFGLTPLEALAAGSPIVVGDTPVAREVYGDAAVYVTPGDVSSIAAALERLLTDVDGRNALLARAPAVLGRYSWERAGRLTLHALLEAARG